MNSLDVISLLRNTDGCVGRRSTHRVPTEADEWSEPVDEYSVTQDERVARKDEYCPTTRSSVPKYSSVVLPFSYGIR